jgi:alkylation response protein AidB-like acyl-CoA dehydrogenase
MDETPSFALTSDQQALYDTVRRFADAEVAPHALEWDTTKIFPRELLNSTAALGLGGIYVPEDVGGSALGRLDAALIFEAMATACVGFTTMITIHNMVAGMINKYASDEQRHRFLPKMCSFEWLASYCLTEPGAGSDAASLSTKAVRDGDVYVLNGVKQFISGAGLSDVYAVMARTGEPGARGISCFFIEPNTPGVSFGAIEKKMGWHVQPTRQVILENARVPVANRIGEEGIGFKAAMNGLDGGRINIAASSLGGAQSALEKALNYMDERKAFGRKLNDFQGLQWRLADMAIELEAARSFLWRAAAALDAQHPRATRLSAMAKRFVTDAGFKIANDALQIFGGYGYLAEYGVEKIVRDLRVNQILEGTNEIMRVIVARALIAEGV